MPTLVQTVVLFMGLTMANDNSAAADLLRQFEGFQSGAYYDRNAYRVGYGSDTWMDDQGNVHPVDANTHVTRAQAEADLARRIPEFQQQGVIPYVGADAWSALTPQAQAAVTSLAYNYGSLAHLPSLVRAIQSGDPAQISVAIQNRGVDNGGVNTDRRRQEADYVAGHPVPLADVLTGTAVGTELSTTPPAPTPMPSTSRPRNTTLLPATAAAGGAARPVQAMTVGQTRAEQQQMRSSLPRATTPVKAATPIIPALGKSVQQIGQEADNGRLNGYRGIQAMGPSSGPQTPVLPSSPSRSTLPVRSGAQPVNTVNVKKNGTVVPVPQAGSVGMMGSPAIAGASAGMGVIKPNMSGSPDDRQKPVTYSVINPAYEAWLKQYGNGGANVSGSPDDRDERNKAAAVPKAPPKTITKTRNSSGGGTPVLPPPVTFKGTSSGGAYVAGQAYSGSGGRTLIAQKDGSFVDKDTGRVSVGSSVSQRSSDSSGDSRGKAPDAPTGKWWIDNSAGFTV